MILLLSISSFGQIRNDRDRDRIDDRRYRDSFMENRRRAPSLSMGVQVVDPVGDFGNNFGGTPAGLAGMFTANLARSPFEIGFGASWNSMGHNSDDILIHIGEDIDGNDLYSDGRMTVNNNIYTYHAVGRFKPFAGPIQPYIDVLGGFKTFSTKAKLREDGASEDLDVYREARDYALSSGWGAGLKVRLNDYIMIEGRFEKLKGGEVDFIDPGSVIINYDGHLDYNLKTSKTNSNVFQLGVSVEF